MRCRPPFREEVSASDAAAYSELVVKIPPAVGQNPEQHVQLLLDNKVVFSDPYH